jgi:hypothetical protein
LLEYRIHNNIPTCFVSNDADKTICKCKVRWRRKTKSVEHDSLCTRCLQQSSAVHSVHKLGERDRNESKAISL